MKQKIIEIKFLIYLFHYQQQSKNSKIWKTSNQINPYQENLNPK